MKIEPIKPTREHAYKKLRRGKVRLAKRQTIRPLTDYCSLLQLFSKDFQGL